MEHGPKILPRERGFSKIVKHIYPKLKAFMLKHSARYKYRKICEAVGFWVIPWQRRYATGKAPMPSGLQYDRGSGKTTAVMLKLLMIDTAKDKLTPARLYKILTEDPDFTVHQRAEITRDITTLAAAARASKINVPCFDISKILNANILSELCCGIKPDEVRKCIPQREIYID